MRAEDHIDISNIRPATLASAKVASRSVWLGTIAPPHKQWITPNWPSNQRPPELPPGLIHLIPKGVFMTTYDNAGFPSKTAAFIVRMRDVTRKVNLSESHIYLLISQGRFPRPFPLVQGGRAKGWLNSTIDEYLTDRGMDTGVSK